MKKKERDKKATTKTTRKFMGKRSKSTRLRAWPPRPKSCRQGNVAEASGTYTQVVQHSSVFVQRYYQEKKEKKKGNSWNVERLTQQEQKKSSWGSQCMYRNDARTRDRDRWSVIDRDMPSSDSDWRKITLSGFCLFFKPRLPQEDGAHLVPYRGITGTDFDSKR